MSSRHHPRHHPRHRPRHRPRCHPRHNERCPGVRGRDWRAFRATDGRAGPGRRSARSVGSGGAKRTGHGGPAAGGRGSGRRCAGSSVGGGCRPPLARPGPSLGRTENGSSLGTRSSDERPPTRDGDPVGEAEARGVPLARWPRSRQCRRMRKPARVWSRRAFRGASDVTASQVPAANNGACDREDQAHH